MCTLLPLAFNIILQSCCKWWIRVVGCNNSVTLIPLRCVCLRKINSSPCYESIELIAAAQFRFILSMFQLPQTPLFVALFQTGSTLVAVESGTIHELLQFLLIHQIFVIGFEDYLPVYENFSLAACLGLFGFAKVGMGFFLEGFQKFGYFGI